MSADGFLLTEPQSVAGRWRAISRTSLKALSTDGEAERQTHTKAIANLLAEVMLACGVPGSFEPVRDALQKSYASALEEIAGLALDFQRVTGELVVSRDLVAVVITRKAISIRPTWTTSGRTQSILPIAILRRYCAQRSWDS